MVCMLGYEIPYRSSDLPVFGLDIGVYGKERNTMVSSSRQTKTQRSPGGEALVGDNEVYRELIEQGPDPGYDTLEIESARSAGEQVRIYKEVLEEGIRDGRA